MGGYHSFSYFYDSLTRNIDYKKRAEYFNMLIKKHGGTKNLLLDLACGTGSLSEKMSRMGYDVIGIDSSEEMLNAAIEKKLESGLEIQYLCQDMTRLDMFGTIDVTICALDGLNHLPSLEAIEQTVRRVSLFCEPRGLFIFDINTPYKHKNILGNNTFVYDTENVFCVWQNTYHSGDDNRVDMVLDFFERQEKGQKKGQGNGLYSRYEDEFSEIAFEESIIDGILLKCGFEIAGKYDYDSVLPPKKDSEKLVYVARKV